MSARASARYRDSQKEVAPQALVLLGFVESKVRRIGLECRGLSYALNWAAGYAPGFPCPMRNAAAMRTALPASIR